MLQQICGWKFYQSVPFQSHFVHIQSKIEERFYVQVTQMLHVNKYNFYFIITAKAYEVLNNREVNVMQILRSF
jgi:hypothetical protein